MFSQRCLPSPPLPPVAATATANIQLQVSNDMKIRLAAEEASSTRWTAIKERTLLPKQISRLLFFTLNVCYMRRIIVILHVLQIVSKARRFFQLGIVCMCVCVCTGRYTTINKSITSSAISNFNMLIHPSNLAKIKSIKWNNMHACKHLIWFTWIFLGRSVFICF